jgi:hypothetical protein
MAKATQRLLLGKPIMEMCGDRRPNYFRPLFLTRALPWVTDARQWFLWGSACAEPDHGQQFMSSVHAADVTTHGILPHRTHAGAGRSGQRRSQHFGRRQDKAEDDPKIRIPRRSTSQPDVVH